MIKADDIFAMPSSPLDGGLEDGLPVSGVVKDPVINVVAIVQGGILVGNFGATILRVVCRWCIQLI